MRSIKCSFMSMYLKERQTGRGKERFWCSDALRSTIWRRVEKSTVERLAFDGHIRTFVLVLCNATTCQKMRSKYKGAEV